MAEGRGGVPAGQGGGSLSSAGGEWIWDACEIRAGLEALGYDVEGQGEGPGHGAGGSLTGRRERGGRAHLVVVDGGGRLRATVTVVEREGTRSAKVAGVDLRLVERATRETTVSGQVGSLEHLRVVLAGLDRVVGRGADDRLD